jgi:hypothetical protein
MCCSQKARQSSAVLWLKPLPTDRPWDRTRRTTARCHCVGSGRGGDPRGDPRHCGKDARIARECEHCGTQICQPCAHNYRFCPGCGAELPEVRVGVGGRTEVARGLARTGQACYNELSVCGV